MAKKLDLISKIFGKLTVISEVEIEKGKSHWKCQCECGKFLIVKGKSLSSGNTKSCGCLKKESINNINLLGQKFGILIVIDKSDNIKEDSAWKCQCECGTEKIVKTKHLRSGDTRSCGCISSILRENSSDINVENLARNIHNKKYLEISFEEFYEMSQKKCFFATASLII